MRAGRPHADVRHCVIWIMPREDKHPSTSTAANNGLRLHQELTEVTSKDVDIFGINTKTCPRDAVGALSKSQTMECLSFLVRIVKLVDLNCVCYNTGNVLDNVWDLDVESASLLLLWLSWFCRFF